MPERLASSAPTRRAFVSYFGSSQLHGLSELLAERGYEAVSAGDVPSGSVAARAVTDAITNADLVIVVFGDARESSNAAFELGLAVGAGKRPVVIAPSDVPLPFSAAELVVVRGSLDNLQAVGEAVDASERLAETRRIDHPSTQVGHLLGDGADRLLSRLREERHEQRGIETEGVVADALQAAGVRVVHGGDSGPDLTVWEPALEPLMGLPLVVEVVGGYELSRRRLELKLMSLEGEMLAQPRAQWGLLVVGPGTSFGDLPELTRGRVLIVGAVELVEAMRTETFADVIRKLRNQHVHG